MKESMGLYEDEYDCGCISGTSTLDIVPQEYVKRRCGKTDEYCDYSKWLAKIKEDTKQRDTHKKKETLVDLCERLKLSIEQIDDIRNGNYTT